MAKDILGREMAPGTSAAAYNKLVTQGPPLMKTVGQGARTVTDTAGQALRNMGALANASPKLLGTPAAAIANLAASGGANFMTGFTGQKYTPNVYEGKSFTDMFGGARPTIPTTALAATPSPVAAPSVARPETTYTPGAGLPSQQQIASDRSRALLAQAASDEQMGIQAPGAPAAINVSRQPNGILSFTGSGGDGTGAVKYSGLPQWTSQRGGAGQGAVGSGFNLGEQNQRMAAFVQGAQADERQKQADSLIGRIAGGAGGAVGVAQNKLAMQQLGPLVERQMANESALGINQTNAATSRRAQDIGLAGDLARVQAMRYGTDVGAKTAAEQAQIEREKVKAVAVAGKGKVDPMKAANAQKMALGMMITTGVDEKGNTLDPQVRRELKDYYISIFGNRDSWMPDEAAQ